MIRTRDFLLYVTVFIFILLGITYTVYTQPSEHVVLNADAINLVASEEQYAATADSGLDRAANLKRLRELIAQGEGEISQGPPVFSSVDVPSTSNETLSETDDNPDAAPTVVARTPQYCAAMNQFETVVTQWPVNGAEIVEREGARVVNVEVLRKAASTTATSSESKMRLQLPLVPQRSLDNHCLDSEIVGITTSGQLISNNETWRFRNLPIGALIGYARDGLPIYNQGADETALDACGGYDTGAGYQYVIRANELFVLGCFVAPPASFID